MKRITITDIGARSDGTKQTAIIQKAIDECFFDGCGEVIIPSGTFVTGGLRLRSNVTLILKSGAVLLGSRDPEDYFCQYTDTVEPYEPDMLSREPRRSNQGIINDYYTFGSRWYNALIKAYKAENIRIIGEPGSLIDGNDCFDENGEEGYRGPHCICCVKCKNIRFEGYEIVNSSNWAHSMWYCDNAELSHVTVNAGHDGCHWRFSENIRIHDCSFSTGDDCVAGYGNKNIIVENCEMNTACSAFRLGTTNALIENCHIYGPPKHLMRYLLTDEEKRAGVHEVTNERREKWTRMLSFFTYASVAAYTKDCPQNENMIFRNCKVENADRFMHFNFSGNEPWQSGCPLTDVRFENISVSGMCFPLTAYGDAQKHISLRMKDCDISLDDGAKDIPLMRIANFDTVELDGVKVSNARGKVLAETWTDGGKIITENLKFSDDFTVRELKTEKFTCDPI